jgi:hypothetical protein
MISNNPRIVKYIRPQPPRGIFRNVDKLLNEVLLHPFPKITAQRSDVLAWPEMILKW